MPDNAASKRLDGAILDIEKLKINYWSLWQELGEIRKEIESMNKIKEKRMTKNEDDLKNEMREWKAAALRDQQKWHGDMVKRAFDIDDLIARHGATLDLLAKPAKEDPVEQFCRTCEKFRDRPRSESAYGICECDHRENGLWVQTLIKSDNSCENWQAKLPRPIGPIPEPEPAECGCIDKASFLEEIAGGVKQFEEHTENLMKAGNIETAVEYDIRTRVLRGVIALIKEGDFDRAPCKSEPAPVITGEVRGFVDKNKVRVRLDDGQFVMLRCDDHFVLPTVTKPALDKGELLKRIDEKITFEQGFESSYGTNWSDKKKAEAAGKVESLKGVKREIESGGWDIDLPAPTAISTANLVEILRGRESIADGIDVTDLGAGDVVTVGWNQPATVIMVRRGEKS